MGSFLAAGSNGFLFQDAGSNDALLYAQHPNASVLIGSQGDAYSALSVSASNLAVNAQLTVNSAYMSQCNLAGPTQLSMQGSNTLASISAAADSRTYFQASGDLMFAPAGQTYPALLYVASNGSVGVGTSNPGAQLDVSTDAARKLSTATWATGCDRRVKTDIVAADLALCYSNVAAIPLVRFAWDSNRYPAVGDRHMLGWLAQDVEAVFPNAVTRSAEHGLPDFRTLNSDQMLKVMYGALQRTMALVEQLQADVALLRARGAAATPPLAQAQAQAPQKRAPKPRPAAAAAAGRRKAAVVGPWLPPA